jgi:chromosome segregation ATPase
MPAAFARRHYEERFKEFEEAFANVQRSQREVPKRLAEDYSRRFRNVALLLGILCLVSVAVTGYTLYQNNITLVATSSGAAEIRSRADRLQSQLLAAETNRQNTSLLVKQMRAQLFQLEESVQALERHRVLVPYDYPDREIGTVRLQLLALERSLDELDRFEKPLPTPSTSATPSKE